MEGFDAAAQRVGPDATDDNITPLELPNAKTRAASPIDVFAKPAEPIRPKDAGSLGICAQFVGKPFERWNASDVAKLQACIEPAVSIALTRLTLDPVFLIHLQGLEQKASELPAFLRYLNEPASYRTANLNSFLNYDMPEPEPVLGPALQMSSVNMVYAERGIGKTQLVLGCATAIMCGDPFLKWENNRARKVALIDGEMTGSELQSRFRMQLNGRTPNPENLVIMTPDMQEGRMPDFADPDDLAKMDDIVDDADVIILDNISTLVRSGGAENDAESWRIPQAWSLYQKSRGKCVIWVHHAGRNGQARGNSKREDPMHTIIKLQANEAADDETSEAMNVTLSYTKHRSFFGADAAPFNIKMLATPQTGAVWEFSEAAADDRNRVWQHFNENPDHSIRQAAEYLGLNQTKVFRMRRELMETGLLSKI